MSSMVTSVEDFFSVGLQHSVIVGETTIVSTLVAEVIRSMTDSPEDEAAVWDSISILKFDLS